MKPFPLQSIVYRKGVRNVKFRILSTVLLMATPAFAQNTQTWVSGAGNDSNSCTFSQPCQTLSGALAKTNAGGEISIGDAGPYGPVAINKSVTISSVSAIGTIVAPPGQVAIAIHTQPSDVVILRGLSLNGGSVDRSGGAAEGIRFDGAGKLHIEHCTVFAFSGEGLNFAPSGAAALFVDNSSFRANNGQILVQPTSTGTANVSVNVVKMEYGMRGIKVLDGTTAIVRNSVANGNGGTGYSAFSIAATPRAATLAVENSMAAQNTGSGVNSSGRLATVRVSNLTAMDNNLYGLNSQNGGTVVTFGNNKLQGNALGNLAPGLTPVPATLQ